MAGMQTTPDTAQAPPPMTRKSWYMRQDVADELVAAVDDLHYQTRLPRHEVLAALAAVALGHRAEIQARLTRERAA